MRRWQQYILERCPPSSFGSMPHDVRGEGGQQRFADYQQFRDDVVNNFGPVAAVTLSMAYRPKVVVEMGVYIGHTTFILCRANPDGWVYAVDISDVCVMQGGHQLPVAYLPALHGVDNLTVYKMESSEFDMTSRVGMCFIDADHIGDAPYKDSLRAWDNRNANGDWCIAWDDYHPSNPDVVNAVDRFVSERDLELHQLMS